MKIARTVAILSGALAAMVAASGANGSNLVYNGGFEIVNNTSFIPGLGGSKMDFATALPDGWNKPGGLTFLAAPGTADDGAKYLAVWGTFPTSSGPGSSGGNFVMQDGDYRYSSPITQMLTIPSAGLYAVTFDQAAGQQLYYNGPTTERWQVTLGSAGTQLSSLMSTPSHGVIPWQSETLVFNVPSAGSYLLQLMAVGTPVGLPPISFIDNVGVDAVPAPASLAMVALGMLGSVARRQRRRTGPLATSAHV